MCCVCQILQHTLMKWKHKLVEVDTLLVFCVHTLKEQIHEHRLSTPHSPVHIQALRELLRMRDHDIRWNRNAITAAVTIYRGFAQQRHPREPSARLLRHLVARLSAPVRIASQVLRDYLLGLAAIVMSLRYPPVQRLEPLDECDLPRVAFDLPASNSLFVQLSRCECVSLTDMPQKWRCGRFPSRT